MKRIAIYGKGGSGKSTITSNLSVLYAMAGRRTLQVGCDPKRDSTLALTGGQPIPSVVSLLERKQVDQIRPEEFLFPGTHGVSCIEAGGPEAGVGCAGRGIVSAFSLMKRYAILEEFDVVLLDVLGDVVCGGFAAPLMHWVASTVAIVVSDSLMSMYAANNIARAIRRFRRNGVHLAGLIGNGVRSTTTSAEIEKFASRLGTRLLACLPLDDRIRQAEKERTPVVLLDSSPDLKGILAGIARDLWEAGPATCAAPTPMDDQELDDFFRSLR